MKRISEGARRLRLLGLALPALVICLLSTRSASAGDPGQRALDAEQVVHLLEYVGSDYEGAVSGGQVVNARELDEQLEVLAEAGRIAKRLAALPGRKELDPMAAVAEVRALVADHRPEADVAAAVKQKRAELVAFFDLVEAPREPPSHEQGKLLYEQHCATCHGVEGRADTARAVEYTPHPASFHDEAIARALSPRRISTTIRFGVPNTAMAPFDFLSEKERWDVAFYVSELDHVDGAGQVFERRLLFDLGELAARSDDELREGLRRAGTPESEIEGALSDLRRRAPYDSAILYPKGSALRVLRARAGVEQCGSRVLRGEMEAAKNGLLSLYLDEIEPLEAPLRAVDPALVRDIEQLFKEVRADIDRRAPQPDIERKLDSLALSLDRAGTALSGERERPSFWATAISSAGIALREGAEAALLIAALLAVVGRAGPAERKRWVHAGWILAVIFGALTWAASRRVVEMSGMRRETLEGASALLAAAVLFYVSYWLFAKRESARWIAYLKSRATSRGAAASLLGIAFLAVYREAFETVIFYQALIAMPGSGPAAGVGALVGMGLLAGLVFTYGRAGKFAPPKSFFAFSTVLLYGLAVVFAGQGLAALQTTGLVPLHPAPLPHLPALGIYPTIETYVAQTALLLLAALAWVLLRAARASQRPVHPQQGAKL